MLRRTTGLLALTLCCTPCAVTCAADLYVICNSGVSLTAGDVRDVFLGEKQFSGAVRLLPADNSAAQSVFAEKALKMDVAKYLTAWTKKSFRDGADPPPLKGSDAEALEYVRRTPGGCSYVGTQPGADVLVVAKL